MRLHPTPTVRHPAVFRRGCSWRVAAAIALVLSGCAGDAVAPSPSINDPQMFWALALDHRAVTLSTVAPYDTIRLTATPLTINGEPLSGLPAPTFTSLDLDRAQVSADGLVRVIKSGTKIPVLATLTVGNLQHADTVFINATNVTTPPVLAAFSIHPAPGDSAKVAMGNSKVLTARAKDADSTAITGITVYYTTSDRTTATIDRATGRLQGLHPGHVSVIATATVYGVTKADTLPYTFGYPVLLFLNIRAQINASGQIVNAFSPAQLVGGPGVVVLINNQTSEASDVTFDDPTNVAQDDLHCAFIPAYCGSGNVAPFVRDTTSPTGSIGRARRFPVPGTYPYHSTTFGTSGTIVVVDEHSTL
jgi:hypothetical protein